MSIKTTEEQQSLLADIMHANNLLEHDIMEKLTASAKRDREESSQPENNSKTPRLARETQQQSKLLLEIEKCFQKQSLQINKAFGEFEEKFSHIFKRLEDVETKILNTLNSRIQQIENNVDNICERLNKIEEITVNDIYNQIRKLEERESEKEDTESIQTEIQNLKMQIRKQDNLAVSCDLRINGIPYTDTERLDGLFNSICNALCTSTPPYKSIYRLKNVRSGPDGTILVQLLTPYLKNSLLKSLSQFRKNSKTNLLLRHIGFDSDRPIHINENLTTHNFKILKAAIGMRKQNLLTSAFSRRGLIYVKSAANNELILIETIVQLNQFFLSPDNTN